jgi:DNA-binding GntR family transcriptional regulator
LDPLRAAIAAGEDALYRQQWQDLGTANIRFHQRLVALAGSPRLDEIMGGLLAELRLAFHVMADPGTFYRPYLPRNREILARLDAGDPAGAERLLRAYLDDAQHQLIDACADRNRPNS